MDLCAVSRWYEGCKNKGNGGESVSQSPLKDQAFSNFLDQNPPFELPPENGISNRHPGALDASFRSISHRGAET
jgi:hypothetical protein